MKSAIVFLFMLVAWKTGFSAEEVSISMVKPTKGEACNRAWGESRRKAEKICKETAVDWDNFEQGECVQEKLKDEGNVQEWKGTITIKFDCLEEKPE